MSAYSFEFSTEHPAGPSRVPFDVTPHNLDPLPVVPEALYVSTAGKVALRGVAGAATSYSANASRVRCSTYAPAAYAPRRRPPSTLWRWVDGVRVSPAVLRPASASLRSDRRRTA